MSPLARALLAAGLGLALALPAQADAQSERLLQLEKRLESSLQLIDKLASRLAELERAPKSTSSATSSATTPAPTAASAAAAEQAQTVAALQASVNQLSDSLSKRGTDTGLPVHGFADVGGAWSGGKDPDKQRGFNGGTLSLYLTPQFGDRVKSLIELAIEYGSDGGVTLDLERLQMGYTVSDALTVWLGRFHTPYGVWNTAYHHGANLQTSVSRPRFLDFEDKGGILPAHSVGVWATGKTALGGGGKLSYDAYVSNGPSIQDRTLDFRAYTDNNGNKMLGFNLGYQAGGALTGLAVGAHGFGSKVQAFDSAGGVLSSTTLRMFGGYLSYDANDWEVLAEAYRFANTDAASGARRSSNAWFAQVGKELGNFTPFARFEKASLNPLDNYFISQASGRSYQRATVGLRYAIDAKSSFKLELGSTRERALTQLDADGAALPFAAANYRRAAVQYSAAF